MNAFKKQSIAKKTAPNTWKQFDYESPYTIVM